jgi:hypothetical protein
MISVSVGRSPMRIKKPQTKRQRKIIRKEAATTIIEEVERFEDLGPRMQKLLLTSPEGTRIYLRVRDQIRRLKIVLRQRCSRRPPVHLSKVNRWNALLARAD